MELPPAPGGRASTSGRDRRTPGSLPRVKDVLAVCAHPDDESFGLGAVLGALSARGTRVRVLCLTHGEASTLGDTGRSLGEVRAEELDAAASALGVDVVVDVDRGRQQTAIACHASQLGDNLVLWRRLELSGNQEHLRWLETTVL